MIMQNPALSSDGPGRHRRGVGVHRRRAAAALRAATRTSRCVVATGDTQAGTRAADLYPSLAAGVPRPRLRALRPRRRWPDSTSCSSACPTAPARRSCPSCSGKVGHLVDLAADFRLQDPVALPPVVRRGAHRARAAARVRLRAARAVPRRDQGRRARRHAGLLPDRRRARAGAPGARRAWSRPPGSSSTPRPGCLAPAGRPSPPPRSAPSTRTSPPTASSTTATRPRWSRSSAPRCCSRPTSRR